MRIEFSSHSLVLSLLTELLDAHKLDHNYMWFHFKGTDDLRKNSCLIWNFRTAPSTARACWDYSRLYFFFRSFPRLILVFLHLYGTLSRMTQMSGIHVTVSKIVHFATFNFGASTQKSRVGKLRGILDLMRKSPKIIHHSDYFVISKQQKNKCMRLTFG